MTALLYANVSFAKEPYKRDNILQKRPIQSYRVSLWQNHMSWTWHSHEDVRDDMCCRVCHCDKWRRCVWNKHMSSHHHENVIWHSYDDVRTFSWWCDDMCCSDDDVMTCVAVMMMWWHVLQWWWHALQWWWWAHITHDIMISHTKVICAHFAHKSYISSMISCVMCAHHHSVWYHDDDIIELIWLLCDVRTWHMIS